MGTWKYTVNIPLWILGKDSEGDTVALYRVNVIVQPPEAADMHTSKPPLFVLRRYSQFRQLHAELKAQYPELLKSKALLPPPKYAFQVGNNKTLLDRRRDELERWMWRLIAKPELAKSAILKTFLDFEKALHRAQQQRNSMLSHPTSPTPSAMSVPVVFPRSSAASIASSDAGDLDDGRSEVSTYSTAASHSTAHALADRPTSSFDKASVYSMEGATPISSSGRLGLRLEQRADVRRMIETLQQRLRQAAADLQGAVGEVVRLQWSNQQLHMRVGDLETQLAGGMSQKEVHLSEQLAAVHKDLEEMKGRAAEAQQLQQRLDAAQQAASHADAQHRQALLQLDEVEAAAEEGRLELDHKVQQLEEALGSMSQKSALLEAQLAQSVSVQDSTELHSQVEQLRQLVEESDRAKAELSTSLAAATVQLEQQEAVAVEREQQRRTDQLMLAKEVKRLRADAGRLAEENAGMAQQLAASKEQQAAADQQCALLGDLRLQVQHLVEQNAKLVGEREALVARVGTAQALSGSGEELAEAIEQVIQQASEARRLQDQVRELQQAIVEREGMVQQGGLQADALRLEVDGLHGRVSELEAERAEVLELVELYRQVQDVQATAQSREPSAAATSAQLEAPMQAVVCHIQMLQEQNVALLSRAQEAAAEADSARAARAVAEASTARLEEVVAEVEALRQQLAAATAAKDAAQQQLSTVAEELGQSKEAVGRLAAEKDHIMAMEAEHTERIRRLEERCEELAAAREVLDVEAGDARRAAWGREREAAAAAEAVERLRAELHSSSEMHQAAEELLQDEVEHLQLEVEQLQAVNEQLQQAAGGALEVRGDVAAGMKLAERRIAELEADLDSARTAMEDVQEQLQRAAAENENLRGSISIASLPAADGGSQDDPVRAAEAGQKLADLQQQVEGLSAQKMQLMADLHKLHELSGVSSEEEFEGNLEVLGRQVENLVAENAALKDAREEGAGKLAELTEQLAALTVENSALKRDAEGCTRLAQQVQQLQAALQSVEAERTCAVDRSAGAEALLEQRGLELVEAQQQCRELAAAEGALRQAVQRLQQDVAAKQQELDGLHRDLELQGSERQEAAVLRKDELSSKANGAQSMAAAPEVQHAELEELQRQLELRDTEVLQYANKASALQQEVESLRAAAAQASSREEGIAPVQQFPGQASAPSQLDMQDANQLQQVLQEVRGTWHELQQCDPEAMGADDPSRPRSLAPEDQLQRLLASNDRLDLVSSQVASVLRAAPGPSPSLLETELRMLCSDIISELASKYRKLNELDCNKLLNEAGPGSAAAPPAPHGQPAADPAGAPAVADAASSVKGVFSKLLSSPATGYQHLAGGPQAVQQLPQQQHASGQAASGSGYAAYGGPAGNVLGGLGQLTGAMSSLGASLGKNLSARARPPDQQ